MAANRCTWCGCEQLEEGWVTDLGNGAKGYAAWVAGPLQKGFFGFAKVVGKTRHEIVAARCVRCSHLELFVGPPG